MKRMVSSDEEPLFQMDRDSGESESISSISRTSTESLEFSTSLSLQEILENMTDSEVEVLGKIFLYVEHMEPIEKASNLRTWVGLNLNMDGYEASLCKTSWLWLTPFGHPSADYEYIEVMMKDDSGTKPKRIIVDVDFRSQFELARPTPTYRDLLNSLPSIFVGTEDKLNKIICLLSSAAKQSLEERGLHIPPWRKATYMQSKWLSENCKKFSFSSSGKEPKFEPKSGNACGPSKFCKWESRFFIA